MNFNNMYIFILGYIMGIVVWDLAIAIVDKK
jgi:hypothetical protein